MLKNMQWWLDFLQIFNGVSILWLQDLKKIDACLAFNASLIGGGAVMQQNSPFVWNFQNGFWMQLINFLSS